MASVGADMDFYGLSDEAVIEANLACTGGCKQQYLLYVT